MVWLFFFWAGLQWGSSFFLLLLGQVRALSGVFMLSLYSGWEAFFCLRCSHGFFFHWQLDQEPLSALGITYRNVFFFLFIFLFLVLSLFFFRHFLLLDRKKNLWLEIVGQNLG